MHLLGCRDANKQFHPKLTFTVSYKMQFCLEVTQVLIVLSELGVLFIFGEQCQRSLCFWLGCFPFRQNCFPPSFGLIYLFSAFDWRSFAVFVCGVVFCADTVAALIMLTTPFFWSIYYFCLPLLLRYTWNASRPIRKEILFLERTPVDGV